MKMTIDVMNSSTTNSVNRIEDDLKCEKCSKPYLRRDLLMRHLRRCQGLKRLTSRRKACDACFQAKAKCSNTEPTCMRCAKRGAPCVYSATSTASTSDRFKEYDETLNTSNPNIQSLSSELENPATSNQLFDLDPSAWDFPAAVYPINSPDMNLPDLGNLYQMLDPATSAADPPIHANLELPPSDQMPSQSFTFGKVSKLMPPFRDSSSPNATFKTSLALLSLVRSLSQYPCFLTDISFSSPLLHMSLYSLYSNAEPDMLLLPITSMAICCATGMNLSTHQGVFKRAITATRQRLIGDFPSYQCMQQWDALHAMLIYECLEMKEMLCDESEAWNATSPTKGLGSPFLRKMAERYIISYPEISNPDVNVFFDPSSTPCAAATSAWARWRTTETARRSIFFANMLHFCGNHNFKTAKQSIYYESLDDELILNMPLPCSNEAWTAQDKKSWLNAMKKYPPSTNHLSHQLDPQETDAFASEISLKDLLSRFSKQYLQTEIGARFGFNDSDELRRLIVLCATEQFA